jgi:hypothetical protein
LQPGAVHARTGIDEPQEKKGKNFNWDEDGEWREEPKLGSDPVLERGVKVKLDGDQWTFLSPEATQKILWFYDGATPKETLQGVKMPDERIFNYRFEGGIWLTQHNPMFPERKPREVNIVYKSSEPS